MLKVTSRFIAIGAMLVCALAIDINAPDVKLLLVMLGALGTYIAQEISFNKAMIARQEKRESDIETYKIITQEYFVSDVMKFVRNGDFASNIESDIPIRLYGFRYHRSNSELVFLNDAIEERAAALTESVRILQELASTNIFPVRGMQGIVSLPEEWLYSDDPARVNLYQSTRTELNQLLDDVRAKYDGLRATARKVLNIP
jgi:hypothetical protein